MTSTVTFRPDILAEAARLMQQYPDMTWLEAMTACIIAAWHLHRIGAGGAYVSAWGKRETT